MKEILTVAELSAVTGGNDGSSTESEELLIVVINGKEYVILPNGVLIPLEEY